MFEISYVQKIYSHLLNKTQLCTLVHMEATWRVCYLDWLVIKNTEGPEGISILHPYRRLPRVDSY